MWSKAASKYDGRSLRVTFQLIDAWGGTHVLADRIDRPIADLFQVQDQIVHHITSKIGGGVLKHLPTTRSDKEVDSLLRELQSRRLVRHFSRENCEKALELERTPLRLDPESVWGYVGTSLMLRNGAVTGWLEGPRDAVLAEAMSLATKAMEIDPDNYMSHYAMARILASLGQPDEAIQHYQRAIELNPSDSLVLIAMSIPLLNVGQVERALDVLKQAQSVDPLHGDWLLTQFGWTYWQLQDCDQGLEALRAMASPPKYSYKILAALHVCAGDIGAAQKAMATYLETDPDLTIAKEAANSRTVWKVDGMSERWLEHMRLAGLPAG